MSYPTHCDGYAIKGDPGPPGPPGADGRAFNPRGTWQTGTAYAQLDAVTHNGHMYYALLDHTSTPATEPGTGAGWSDVWALIEPVAPSHGSAVLSVASSELPTGTPVRADLQQTKPPLGCAVENGRLRILTGGMWALTASPTMTLSPPQAVTHTASAWFAWDDPEGIGQSYPAGEVERTGQGPFTLHLSGSVRLPAQALVSLMVRLDSDQPEGLLLGGTATASLLVPTVS